MSASRRLISCSLSLILSLSPAMIPLAHSQTASDIKPPQVLHEPDSESVSSNLPHVISATVSDENGVGKVTLFFRAIGESVFNSVDMTPTSSGDVYMTELDASLLTPPGLEYYIQAEDTAGNTLLRGFTFEPLVLNVTEGADSSTLASESAKEVNESSLSSNKWLWIGLGVLAVGGLAAGGGGGGGGGSNDGDTVTISAPIPQ
ncbi:MAG: hypothetical protein KDJ38_09660 [Gammaproteobacteria bacterium]|nr:hypothetical protein [Gammaproteobacteria bacterium]